MPALRHSSVRPADPARGGADVEVLDVAAAAIRDVLAPGDVDPAGVSLLVIASSGVPAGEDPESLVLENAFNDRIVRELAWESGLAQAVPVAVGMLGEPLLTSGVLVATGLLQADRLDAAVVVVLNGGEPGTAGAGAFLLTADEGAGLVVGAVSARGDGIADLRRTLDAGDPAAPAPGAGQVEVSLRPAGRSPAGSVEDVLGALRRMADGAPSAGDRVVLVEAGVQGLGGLTLERPQS